MRANVLCPAVLERGPSFHPDDAGARVLVGDLECGDAAEEFVVFDRLGPDEGRPGEGVGVQERLGRGRGGGWEAAVGSRGVVVDGDGAAGCGDVEICAVGGPEEAVFEGDRGGRGGKFRVGGGRLEEGEAGDGAVLVWGVSGWNISGQRDWLTELIVPSRPIRCIPFSTCIVR